MSAANAPPVAMILSTAARTHNAVTALQVAMNVRAGKMDPRATHLVDRSGEPMAMCRLLSIGDDVTGFDRYVDLAVPTLRQALLPVVSNAHSGASVRVPVVVALPEPSTPGFDPRLTDEFIAVVRDRLLLPVDTAGSRVVCEGRAAGARAFQIAIDLLDRGDAAMVCVGGVDSYFDPDRLEALDAALRLHSLECENGFIPGEGAAFVCLSRRGTTTLPPLAALLGVASAREPHPYGAVQPCQGEGITRAVRAACAPVGLEARSIGWILTDVVNERHRVDEWMYAWSRVSRAFDADAIHDQPLLETGDLGAASVPAMASVATTLWQVGGAPAPAALIAAHSEGASRAAVVLRSEVTA